ncbi:MAG: N-acetylglucosamine-6-phosphate deacetylase [Lachnospiraceae bacterium]|nr:N-acetylglucosamine-6-phosphate deacetylase [Lachnospiraceae bacterium]
MTQRLTGNIFTKEGTIKYGTAEIEDGKIVSVDAKSDSREDAEYILPGLTDIHSHGCMAHDTCDASVEGLVEMANFQLSQGVTSYFPTTMTFDEERLLKVVDAVREASILVTNIKGIYLEGPFISPNKVGAQNPKYVQAPDFDMLVRLQKKANGLIRFVAIAPEVKGAAEFIRKVRTSSDPDINKIKLTIAHTTADYDTAYSAITEGADHITHLYNAMPPYNHREPGVIGAVYDSKAVAEMICDGIHIHPAVIRNTFRTLGPDRICLISDSCEAAGMPDGLYELGGQPVRKTGRRAVLDNSDTIAGSASTLLDCLRYTVFSAHVPMEQAVIAAAVTPAREAGMVPDGVIVLDKDLKGIVHERFYS